MWKNNLRHLSHTVQSMTSNCVILQYMSWLRPHSFIAMTIFSLKCYYLDCSKIAPTWYHLCNKTLQGMLLCGCFRWSSLVVLLLWTWFRCSYYAVLLLYLIQSDVPVWHYCYYTWFRCSCLEMLYWVLDSDVPLWHYFYWLLDSDVPVWQYCYLKFVQMFLFGCTCCSVLD